MTSPSPSIHHHRQERGTPSFDYRPTPAKAPKPLTSTKSRRAAAALTLSALFILSSSFRWTRERWARWTAREIAQLMAG
ncbi:unnamed protein product [Linum trigynum]|uniref:Uncharacterized protein n=1 Tax=Linum trigynum TaxID=586398 RepID=A0AAV2EZE2_9ROSI